MAQGMGAGIWQPDPTARTFDDLLYRTRCDRRSSTGNLPNKDSRVTDCRSLVLDIVGKRLASLLGKWNYILPLRLGTVQGERAGLPVNICKVQVGNLTRAQSQIQRQTHNGICALGRLACCSGRIQ
ncbi:hypothetical protein SDC9_194838 [bioreactor metagenome]|uniref:Uncharacterized protein n=1 Tax=bioreactor metagenome TaxID=1076179 RepID=A0A645I7C7_9ZZZZ